jgi:glycosyltransferase involved in cell wall biosynthesis
MPETDSLQMSIIIPVYNDPEGIRSTIASLTEQPQDSYEIIPVDNDSTDDTAVVIDELESEFPELIYPTEETDIQGSYAARNAGIARSKGDILAFIDSGITVKPQWAETVLDEMTDRECDYLGYDVKLTTSENPTIWERYERAFSFPMKQYLLENNFTGAGALVVRRKVIGEVGGFDEQLESGGDKDFGTRVHDAGFQQCFSDIIQSYHPARQSRHELVKKAKRVGRGHLQLRNKATETNVAHPLHPFRLLPPSPFRLSRQLSHYEDPYHMYIIYYLMEYYIKIIQTTHMYQKHICKKVNKFRTDSKK